MAEEEREDIVLSEQAPFIFFMQLLFLEQLAWPFQPKYSYEIQSSPALVRTGRAFSLFIYPAAADSCRILT
ncbi:hypothetical protein CJ483_06940 [Bacillus sp. PK3_68]|nr:hypothetical protein CJ483_06940 [Bacillus sp. PK3_68]